MIDKKAYQKMDYALCLLSTHADGKDSGCIINSFHQVTSSFPRKVYHCRQSRECDRRSGRAGGQLLRNAARPRCARGAHQRFRLPLRPCRG